MNERKTPVEVEADPYYWTRISIFELIYSGMAQRGLPASQDDLEFLTTKIYEAFPHFNEPATPPKQVDPAAEAKARAAKQRLYDIADCSAYSSNPFWGRISADIKTAADTLALAAFSHPAAGKGKP